ncbi:uncharacterized protein LOC105385435 [Plutella xylostella]|uniref:uncharacterized protein LOC105385435 n=1 Tax=Plutella xylostella TaxID=51655 RepID=UPI00203253DC|nr:uncharacterized protein LOC105385435 [Plutella xylostella]
MKPALHTLVIATLLTKVHYAFCLQNENGTSPVILQNGGSYNDMEELNVSAPTKVLSRRKRFIVFPDGSSFQLVFCAQNMGFVKPRDVVWFGNTAALAWELPTDPKIFHIFKDFKNQDGALRRSDAPVQKNIYYLDEKGKLIAKVPYHKKFIVNPAFAKRSVDFPQTIDDRENLTNEPISKPEMHKLSEKADNLKCKESLEECNIEFHREGRKDLYGKLETFIEALGWRGRECVLRMLCEAGKDKAQQGTFLDEIVRAVFTLPGGHEFEEAYHREYDSAHQAAGDCRKLFPECQNKFTSESI